MRTINYIVVHCSATREDRPFTVEALRAVHLSRGFSDIGYHYYIRRDGTVVRTRPLALAGAHVKGYNKYSIGICYEGGLDARGARRIPVHRNSVPPCDCWYINFCAVSMAKCASAVIAISVRTGMETGWWSRRSG